MHQSLELWTKVLNFFGSASTKLHTLRVTKLGKVIKVGIIVIEIGACSIAAHGFIYFILFFYLDDQ